MHSISAMPSLARLLAFISAVLFGVLFSQAQAQSLSEAQRLLKQGKTAQALELADAYTAKNPKDPQGRFLKGVILTDQGKSNEAIAIFTKMTEDFPELPEPYNNLAVLYAQQKQYDKAKMALEMAIRTHPSYSTAHENLGDLYAKLASQAYGKALQIDSASASTQTKLAMITDLITPSPSAGNAGNKSSKPVVVASTEPTKAPPSSSQATTAKPEKKVEQAPISQPVSQPVAAQKAEPSTNKPVEKASESTTAVAPQNKPATSDKTSSSAADVDVEIKQVLQKWADAWSRKDVKAYLSFYAKNFETPDGMPRKAWETERRKRIDKPGALEITLSNIKVDASADKATVKFRQRYVSPTFKGNANKTLKLEKSGNNWKIVQESTS